MGIPSAGIEQLSVVRLTIQFSTLMCPDIENASRRVWSSSGGRQYPHLSLLDIYIVLTRLDSKSEKSVWNWIEDALIPAVLTSMPMGLHFVKQKGAIIVVWRWLIVFRGDNLIWLGSQKITMVCHREQISHALLLFLFLFPSMNLKKDYIL